MGIAEIAPRDFYVYVLLDPRLDGRMQMGRCSFLFEPFYIGKGKGSRTYYHRYDKGRTPKAERWREIVRETGNYPMVMLIGSGMTEEAAFIMEREFISMLGRKSDRSGPLLNVTAGGQGISGMTRTPEQRQRMSDRQKGKPRPYLHGRQVSAETRRKISEGNKGKIRTPEMRAHMAAVKAGCSPPNKGKPMPAHVLEAIRAGFWRSYEEREKLRLLTKSDSVAEKPKRIMSDATRKKLSAALKGRIKPPEERENISRGKRGKPNHKLRGRKRPPEVIAKIKATKARGAK